MTHTKQEESEEKITHDNDVEEQRQSIDHRNQEEGQQARQAHLQSRSQKTILSESKDSSFSKGKREIFGNHVDKVQINCALTIFRTPLDSASQVFPVECSEV